MLPGFPVSPTARLKLKVYESTQQRPQLVTAPDDSFDGLLNNIRARFSVEKKVPPLSTKPSPSLNMKPYF